MDMINVLSERTEFDGEEMVKQIHTSYYYNSNEKDNKLNLLEVESNFTVETLEDGSIKRTRHEDVKHHEIENIMIQITDESFIVKDNREISRDYHEVRPEGEWESHFVEDQNRIEDDNKTIIHSTLTNDGRDGYNRAEYTIYKAKEDQVISRDFIESEILSKDIFQNTKIKAGDNINHSIADLILMSTEKSVIDDTYVIVAVDNYDKEKKKNIIYNFSKKDNLYPSMSIQLEVDDQDKVIGVERLVIKIYNKGESSIVIYKDYASNKYSFMITELESDPEKPLDFKMYEHNGEATIEDQVIELKEDTTKNSIITGTGKPVEGTEDEYTLSISTKNSSGTTEESMSLIKGESEEPMPFGIKGFKRNIPLENKAPETEESDFEDDNYKVNYKKTIESEDKITREYDIEVKLGSGNFINMRHIDTPTMKAYLYATLTKDEKDRVTSIDSKDFSLDTNTEVEDEDLKKIIDDIEDTVNKVREIFNIE